MHKRLQVQFILILLLLGGLAARLFQIQIFNGLAYAEMAQRQFVKKVTSETIRGEILDRNRQLLAASVECLSIFANPKEIDGSQSSYKLLGKALEVEPRWLKTKMSSKGEFVWLERKIDPVAAEAIARQNIKGLGMVREQKRYYPNGPLACHLLGAVGLDNTGLSGIEQTMDAHLKGKFVTLTQLRDGKGRRMNPAFDENPNPDAKTITLTIDRGLQYYAEKELKAGVEENLAKSGMIILQNPKTGEILAMASYPDFDPNLLSKGAPPENFDKKSLGNPAICQLFEPGSTFKVVTLAAAIEEKSVAPGDLFNCENGKWKIAGSEINDHEPSGTLSVSQILEKSSNIGTAKIGLKLGREKLYRYARAFGFGTRTGIAVPGETEGLFRDPKKWSPLSLPILSFGQEIGVTAIQMVGAYSAIANGGALLEPQIIRGVESDAPGGETSAFSPRVVRQAVSPETAAVLREMMRKVVDQGTGVKAQVPGYSVCGKTGTAQKLDPRTKKYSKEKYVASFCGFMPADNPLLVCLVILDEPRRTYWGGETAAPIFSRVMSRAAQVLGIPPTKAALLADGVKSAQEVRLLASKR